MDSIRWIGTDIMLADPPIKSMISDKLTEALRTDKWDPARPIESLQKRSIKQSQRAAAEKENKKGVAAPETDEVAIGLIIGDYVYESVIGVPRRLHMRLRPPYSMAT